MKEKNAKILKRLILVLLIAVMLFSLYRIGMILYEYYDGHRQYKKLEALAEADQEGTADIDFDALRDENPDVVAWIFSENTVINYPVLQGEDNSTYLYRTALGEWASRGSIFIDFRCRKPFRDFNTILYGHRMKDGSMFYPLTKYEKPSYLKKHPVMQMFTPEHAYDAEIFAAVRIPADSSLYRVDFDDRAEREAYLRKVKKQNLIQTQVNVSPDDRIVMMSTCTYEFEDARLALYGKLTERK